MEAKKMISTIITTYKRSDSLPRAIESVLNQTYNNIEIIVVDDNDSKSIYRQKTEKIMLNYQDAFNVKYIKHKKNRNGANARNTGIENASGEYITFLDDDDEFDLERFNKLIPQLESSYKEYGLICSAFNYCENEKVVKTNEVQLSSDVVFDLLSDNFNIGSGSNFILKRSVVDKIGFFDSNFLRHQDWEYLVRVADSYKFLISEEPLLNVYRDSSQQNKVPIEQLISTKKLYLKKYKKLVDERNSKKIINSQIESVFYLIFNTENTFNHDSLLQDYIMMNGKLTAYVKLLKLKIKAIIRKKIQPNL